MAWAGAAESDYGHGTAVAFSPNGDIIASGHESTIMISDANSHERLQTFFVDFFVESIEFTSDAQFLLIGMVSTLPDTPATVVYENVEGDYERRKHTEDGINVDRISVSPNDNTFATAIEDGQFVEWEINTSSGTNLDINRQYPSAHSGHITCLDHSTDGIHLLSGATDGVVILWNRESLSEVARWESVNPISDCQFSHDGTIMAWIGGGSLSLRNHDSTQSYHGQFDISMNATEMSFTPDDNEVAVLVPTIVEQSSRRIDFIDIESSPISLSRTLYVSHNAYMFSLHPYDDTVAISTFSELVPFYSDSVPVESEIPTLIDSDQDNIPDSLDIDDDGDGIPDQFDNICIEGNNCHLQPNQQTIRQFTISINGDFVNVIESIHLDAIHSSHIRQLASSSMNANHRVDTNEFDQFEFSLCDEYNPEGVMTRWATYLSIDDYAFNPNTVQCRIDSGLYGTMDSDLGTRISISWEITGRILNPVLAPYNISIISGIPIASSSVAQNVHSFPVHVHIEDVSGSSVQYEVWNRRDANVFLTIQPPQSDEEPMFLGLHHHIFGLYFSITIVFVILSIGLVMVRRKNRIDFDDDDDSIDSYEYDDEWETMVDDAAAWDDEIEEESFEKTQPRPPSAVSRDIRGTPQPPGAVQRDLARQKRDGPKPKPKMRKVRRTVESQPQEHQPEDTVGFTHLITESEHPVDSENSDEREISDALEQIKSEQDEDSKRRRPVKRKKSKD